MIRVITPATSAGNPFKPPTPSSGISKQQVLILNTSSIHAAPKTFSRTDEVSRRQRDVHSGAKISYNDNNNASSVPSSMHNSTVAVATSTSVHTNDGSMMVPQQSAMVVSAAASPNQGEASSSTASRKRKRDGKDSEALEFGAKKR